MSDTPQNGEVAEVIEQQPVINDSVPVSEAGSQVQGESSEQPVDAVAQAQEKANVAFNKQYGEKMQLKRDLETSNVELARLRQEGIDRQAAAVGEIPPMPDAFDDDYDQKVNARDEAIRNQANFNAQNQAYQNQQQQIQQGQLVQQQQASEKVQNDFLSNARGTGATDTEIASVVNTLVTQGLSGDLGSAVMADEDGYFIAKHLAANPVEAFELSQMNPYAAGAKFAELKVKAGALKPKQSNTPEPVDNLQGNGVDPKAGNHKNLGGVVFS